MLRRRESSVFMLWRKSGDVLSPRETHKGGERERVFSSGPLYPHGLPFRQLYDTQILEIQIRGWIMRLQTERACGQARFLAGVGAFRASVGVVAHLNAIHIDGNV